MVNNEQRRQLLANQENRAQAAEGREAEIFGHQKSQWTETQDQMLAKQLEAAGLSNDQARQIIEKNKFDLDTQAEEFGFMRNADKRADRALDISANQASMEASRLGLSEAEYLQRKKAQEQDYEFNEKVNPLKIEAAEATADPSTRYSADIQALASLARNTADEDTRNEIIRRAMELHTRGEAEKQAWLARRRQGNPAAQGPQSAPPQQQQPQKSGKS